MTTALLIIDVQRALCKGEWAADEIGAVIERINGVAAKARAAGALVVLIQHEEADGPLEFGADGWQLDPRLAVVPTDHRLRKTAPDSFHRTELQAVLERAGVDRVIACGLQSEFCVDSTVRGALAHGYAVVLAADAHSTLGNGVLTAPQIRAHHNTTLAGMSSFGPRVSVLPAAAIEPKG